MQPYDHDSYLVKTSPNVVTCRSIHKTSESYRHQPALFSKRKKHTLVQLFYMPLNDAHHKLGHALQPIPIIWGRWTNMRTAPSLSRLCHGAITAIWTQAKSRIRSDDLVFNNFYHVSCLGMAFVTKCYKYLLRWPATPCMMEELNSKHHKASHSIYTKLLWIQRASTLRRTHWRKTLFFNAQQ